MDFDKFRLRFRKTGLLRFISHHDLMRALERMLRRANLPFRSTSGFHPHPRIVFALSLPLGVEGCDEVVELELTQALPPEEVLARLCAQAPAGLEFLSIRRVPPQSTAQVCRAHYAISAPQERQPELAARCAALLTEPKCFVMREHPQPRQVDIRPYIRDLRVEDDKLCMDFQVTPNGTARADEVLGLLAGRDLLNAGAVLARTRLELLDETVVNPESPIERRMSDLRDQRQMTTSDK